MNPTKGEDSSEKQSTTENEGGTTRAGKRNDEEWMWMCGGERAIRRLPEGVKPAPTA